MAKPVFALVDCNNFFVSCERIFRPDLATKPVVVLSSNDGCAVARSNEAKTLGIPMGAPAFKYRDVFERHNIIKFSANFELYGDISRRIIGLLKSVTPHIEVYSIDESFLDLSELPINDYDTWGRAVSKLIYDHIGVPVSIGIASSKTLAKLASEVAKSDEVYQGAFSFIELDDIARTEILDAFPVSEVWGIGWRLGPKIRAEGCLTAGALAHMSPRRAAQLMGVHGRQLVAELNGISCLPLSIGHDPAKSIMRSRTFGEDTNNKATLESAIATLSGQAAFKLRTEHLTARTIGIFTTTSKHKPGFQSWTREVHLTTPTSDTGLISNLLTGEMLSIYSESQQYHRLGVYLYDFVPDNALQVDLLGLVDSAGHSKAQARLRAVDTINDRWGKGKLYYAAEDLNTQWRPKQLLRSPRYVSQWSELPEARIS